MPKRADMSSILGIVAGPIIIGQACEFEYFRPQDSFYLFEKFVGMLG